MASWTKVVTESSSGNISQKSATSGTADNIASQGDLATLDLVDSAEIEQGSIDLAHISATGTTSSSTYLKGDWTWGTISDSDTTNSSMSFNTTTGVLTITDSAGTDRTADLDGKYQDSGNYITGTGSLSSQNLTDIGNLSGENSGDQTLPTLASLGIDTDDDVTFANLTLSGDLTINGNTIQTDTETILIADNTLVLNSDKTATADVNSGIVVERGGDGNNKSLYWDEGDDKWAFGESSSVEVEGTYLGDVVVNFVDSSYTSSNSKVPIGHFQFDTTNKDLYVRTA